MVTPHKRTIHKRRIMDTIIDAGATYHRAIDHLLRYQPEVVDLATELGDQHPDHAMGHALMAYLCLIATDVPELAHASVSHAAMVSLPLDSRESMHAAAIGAWLNGDWHGAAGILDDVLDLWPTDALALLVGHQLDFFLGDARNLRDRPARALAALDAGDPRVGPVLGMYAFGLEEAGQYAKAEDVGMAALDVHADDVWAIHAVAHTMEMRGQVDRGIPFLRRRVAEWGDGNLFVVHNWWHLALFELEAGRHREVLDIYDARLHHADAAGVPLEMLDASALLWRLLLDGIDAGPRFAALADAWSSRTHDAAWYAFNDLHAAMAFAGAGRRADVGAVVAKLRRQVDVGGNGSNVAMTAEVGLPATLAVQAFVDGRYDDVISTLAPIRRRFHVFGGSHAQRDALQRTLLEAALRAGRHQFADELIGERLDQRDASVYAWTRRQRLLAAAGNATGADEAANRVATLRTRFSAAAAA